jgi:hypothetical protein
MLETIQLAAHAAGHLATAQTKVAEAADKAREKAAVRAGLLKEAYSFCVSHTWTSAKFWPFCIILSFGNAKQNSPPLLGRNYWALRCQLVLSPPHIQKTFTFLCEFLNAETMLKKGYFAPFCPAIHELTRIRVSIGRLQETANRAAEATRMAAEKASLAGGDAANKAKKLNVRHYCVIAACMWARLAVLLSLVQRADPDVKSVFIGFWRHRAEGVFCCILCDDHVDAWFQSAHAKWCSTHPN